MVKHYICFIIIGSMISFAVSKHVQFYRKDYSYNEEYDAFYKVHWDVNGISWSSAFRVCDDEGAKLFYPNGDEWTIIKNLTDVMAAPPNSTEIFVGLHNEFNLGEFITLDGHATVSPLNAEDHSDLAPNNRCILMDFTTGLFSVDSCLQNPDNPTPFVCKKVDTESCPTIDQEYKYVKSVKKCYKVNRRVKTWEAAMQTCFMEGGLLAVLGDTEDVRYLLAADQYYFVGFKRMFDSFDFYTVKGHKFENAYFEDWSDKNRQEFNCGMIKYESYNRRDMVEATFCTAELPFICEMTARA